MDAILASSTLERSAQQQVASTGVSPRTVSKTLTLTNANDLGDWGGAQYCGKNTYAVGYNMKIEDPQGGTIDDTALNGIRILCQSPSGHSFGRTEATSSVGPWDDWKGEAHCDSRGGQQYFLKSFRLQSEEKQGGGDYTSANFVKFKCRPFDDSMPSYEMSKDPGFGEWGKYGSWSSECPRSSSLWD